MSEPNSSGKSGSFEARVFLSRYGAILESPELLTIQYRESDASGDGVEFIAAENENGEQRYIDDYHLPTILHMYRRHLGALRDADDSG